MSRPRPRGILRPNQAALRRGLVFAWDGAQADSPPWIASPATAQVAYMRGGVVVSGAPASYGDTSGADFTIGDHGFFPFPFTQNALGGVHSVLIFNRAFTASEWAAHEADPWWWARETRPPRRWWVGVLRRLLPFIFRR